ncbi:hypothetical protein [uncultured Winogradskyella sp.]|uniref:hypothetical protein n=1 Tax=uncultured Winogradskyella sp. TaxID=395353 RepID=UPI0030D78CFC|tara:strand:+ start:102027 stop:102935 length:909 start_codon:yes stop_codon:yes gene_type:complete
MKGFIKSIILFLIPIVVLAISLETIIRHIPNSYELKSEYLENNAERIETLILGSSHSFYGINPKYFTAPAFNMSNVSQSPDVDLAILKSYEHQLTNLKTVVIRLSYDTLFEQLKLSPEDWRLKDYKLYTNVDLDYTLKHNSEVLAIGLKQSLEVLKNEYFNNMPLLNCDSLGFGKVKSQLKKIDLDNAGRIAAKRHTISSWYLLHKNSEVFKKIIEHCNQRHIKVLVVTPPAYKSYVNNLNTNQVDKMVETGISLGEKYENCSYHNFMTRLNLIHSDFYDADHLNSTGAKKFSLILNSLIEN